MRKNNTKWLAHVQAVLATIGTGEFNFIQDKKTYGAVSKAVSGLFHPRGIDGKVKDALLSNIRIRAKVDIEHDGPIVLSRHQRTYAAKMGWKDMAPFDQLYADGQSRAVPGGAAETTAETEVEDAELMEAFQQYFSIVSASFQHQFSTVSADMTPNLAEKLRFWYSSKLMETKLNHEPGMIAASHVHEEPGIQPSITPEVQPEQHDGTEPPPIHPGSETEELGHRKRGADKRDALTIWVKEDKRRGKLRATGNLEVGGIRFPLSFNPFFGELEAIPETQGNGAWLSMMASDVADAVVPQEAKQTGVASYSTMSGLYASEDTHCFKSPVMDQQVVILHWEGTIPTAATIIDGDSRVAVPVKFEGNSRFKGAVNLA
jgi:hypothetical protein